jgi:hypothetical protein
MPPQRIFPELTGIAQYQKEKGRSTQKVSEEEVVETVGKFRQGLLDEEAKTSSGPISLKKDNVSPLKVVKIIDEKRKEDKEKKTYQKLTWPLPVMTMKGKIDECLSPKIEELKSIFAENDSSMEWMKIVDEVTKEEQTACGVLELALADSLIAKVKGDFSDCRRYHVQEKIIRRVEGHKLIQKYTVLNKEFEHRIKEENREKDVKNVNEKRAQKSPKQQQYRKKRGIDNRKN